MKEKTYAPDASSAVVVPQAIVGQVVTPVETRVIPNPPGGGSWTWDPLAWEWVDNYPTPEIAVTTSE